MFWLAQDRSCDGDDGTTQKAGYQYDDSEGVLLAVSSVDDDGHTKVHSEERGGRKGTVRGSVIDLKTAIAGAS